jgi:hypothetical protein
MPDVENRWFKAFDLKMHGENRQVCLTVDNFSGHEFAYKPTNVLLVFFKPNLTSFIQPLDAGIIRCFKAHYRRAFCYRALDLDDAGERDIYNINLLEAMLMAKDAWNAITVTTIENCWDHTGIQRDPIEPITLHIHTSNARQAQSDPHNTAAWDLIESFATTEMTLSQAEDGLKNLFGDGYVAERWMPALDAVMNAEDDVNQALDAIKQIRLASPSNTALVSSHATTAQGSELEVELMESVKELKERNRIFGPILTLDELLDPVDELEIGQSASALSGEEEIVAKVHREQAIERGEIIEVDSDEGEDADMEGAGEDMSVDEMIHLSERLERASLSSAAESSLEVARVLRHFRAQMVQVGLRQAKQATLPEIWG